MFSQQNKTEDRLRHASGPVRFLFRYINKGSQKKNQIHQHLKFLCCIKSWKLEIFTLILLVGAPNSKRLGNTELITVGYMITMPGVYGMLSNLLVFFKLMLNFGDGSKNTLCHSYWLSPYNQASLTIFDKGRTLLWEGEGEREKKRYFHSRLPQWSLNIEKLNLNQLRQVYYI